MAHKYRLYMELWKFENLLSVEEKDEANIQIVVSFTNRKPGP